MDNRLKKHNKIILTRAQKGFTKNRQIQECIINIVETISFSEKNKILGFVLAQDMAKAFDMVRHDFMNKVYKFYGIGPNMTKFLNTISTGRTAAILREDGSASRPFYLRTGFLQGSPPSPNEFNICEQILLLKLKFDPNIIKLKPNSIERGLRIARGPVPLPAPVPVPVPVPVAAVPVPRRYGQAESNGETAKVESFADDTTPMGKLTEIAIFSIKNTLNNFALISGLKCNVEKSQIMTTGTNGAQIPNYITDSGFEVVEKVKILGFEISLDHKDLVSNF
jgi:hypothetical protein